MNLMLKDSEKMLTISKNIFGCKFNEALIHQVIVAYAAFARQGSSSQKTRAEVIGSNKKPWRQKGTGRARSGSTKSPIWRSGGVTFASKTRDYTKKVNKKMYRGALRSILSELLRKGRLIVVTQFSIELPKTKILIEKLKSMSLKNVSIVIDKLDYNLSLAARNLYSVKIHSTTTINPISLITSDKVVMTVAAVKQIEEMLV